MDITTALGWASVIATGCGSAFGAGIAAYRVAASRSVLGRLASKAEAASNPVLPPDGRTPSSSPLPPAPTPYVRLTADDARELARVATLLERVVALEEQTQAYVHQLAEQVIALRIDQARRG